MIAAMLKRWGAPLALVAASLLSAAPAAADILIPTIRPTAGCTPVASPNLLIPAMADYELVLPTHSDTSDKTLGVLRYDGSNVSGSEADNIYPVGTFGYRYFYVACNAGVNEVVMRAPISGSPTTANPPSGSNDHTRVEMRQRTPGPGGHETGNPGFTKGDFLLAEKLQMTGLCRPMQMPARDNSGSTTSDNNLTLMQLQPTDGTSGANTTFVILALRRSGVLQATMRNADGSNAASPPYNVPVDLLTGVQLGDLIWWRVTTSATTITWQAENRTRAPGVIQTLTQTVPDVTAFGVNQRTRYHAHKWGSYQGTNVWQSQDDVDGKRVSGVVSHDDVTDAAQVNYLSLVYEYLP